MLCVFLWRRTDDTEAAESGGVLVALRHAACGGGTAHVIKQTRMPSNPASLLSGCCLRKQERRRERAPIVSLVPATTSFLPISPARRMSESMADCEGFFTVQVFTSQRSADAESSTCGRTGQPDM